MGTRKLPLNHSGNTRRDAFKSATSDNLRVWVIVKPEGDTLRRYGRVIITTYRSGGFAKIHAGVQFRDPGGTTFVHNAVGHDAAQLLSGAWLGDAIGMMNGESWKAQLTEAGYMVVQAL